MYICSLKNFRMKKVFLIASLTCAMYQGNAQDNRVITTGVPFLMVAADARSAGLADQGVATSMDAFSQQYNPAKYAFAEDKMGFSASYTPYLTGLVNDISLGQITYFNKINERSAFATSLRYFGLGEINQTNQNGDPLGNVSPNELAFDGSYSLKLSEKFSMGIAARYIRSNLRVSTADVDATSANTFAVDVAGYYQSDEQAFTDFNGRWRAGFNFQNLGPKINYDDSQFNANFIPSNLRLGTGYDFGFDDYNKVTVSVEMQKLLVPTPRDFNDDGVINGADSIEYNKIGWTQGIFTSFGDAPGGFGEEIREVTYSAAAEYNYQDSFALRLGYFNEDESKGARKFFSLGAGFKYNVVKLDVSYLFSASQVRNPLENTLRFSLTFNFGEKFENN